MPIPQKLLNEGERVVLSTRTHPKALVMAVVWLVLLLAAAVFASSLLDGTGDRVVSWVAWGLAGIGILRLSVWPFLDWLTSFYAITDRRLITRTGVVTRRGHDIPLTRVSDVAIELHLVDRVLGCGTLIVSDASTHGQVELPDIPRVEETQRRLNDLLHTLNDPSPRGEGA